MSFTPNLLSDTIAKKCISTRYSLNNGVSFEIRPASCSNVDRIVQVVNEAYEADAYFKIKGLSDRTDRAEIESLIHQQDTSQSCLICSFSDDGTLFGTFQVSITTDDTNQTTVCNFRLLSVSNQFKGSGFGSLVLNQIVVTIANYYHCSCIELLSINPAEKLREWYKNTCGFKVIDRVDAPQELLAIVLPDSRHLVYFWRMRKFLS